jgi:hypothetical protein
MRTYLSYQPQSLEHFCYEQLPFCGKKGGSIEG